MFSVIFATLTSVLVCSLANDMEVICSPQWNVNQQNFDIRVEWTTPDDLTNLVRFRIEFRQVEGFSLAAHSVSHVDKNENGSRSYSILKNDVSPVRNSLQGLYIVNPIFSSETPGTYGSCQFSLSPPTPSQIGTLVIISHTIISEMALGKIIAQVPKLNLEWLVPDEPVASLSSLGYELWIGTNNSQMDSGEVYNLNNINQLNMSAYSGNITNLQDHFEISPVFMSVFIKLRTFYEVTFDMMYRIYSPWTETKELPVPDQTNTESSSSSSTSSSTSTSNSISIETSNTYIDDVMSTVELVVTTNSTTTFSPTEVQLISSSSSNKEDRETLSDSTESISASITKTQSISSFSSSKAGGTLSESTESISTSIRPSIVAVMDASDNQMITIILAVLVPVLLLVFLIIVVAVLILCARKRHRDFQILSHELDSSTTGLDDDVFVRGKSTFHSTASFSKHKLLETSFEECDEWEVPMKSVIIIKRLGEGCFGEVYKGEINGFKSSRLLSYQARHNGGLFVAIKVLKGNASNQEKNDFLKEIELMKIIASGNNPHVVNMLCAVTRQEPMCVVTEFLEHGDLLSYLKNYRKKQLNLNIKTNNEVNGYIQENQPESIDLISFAYQIASGMEYLSSLKVIHRDLACRNVLVGEGMLLKVSDFGLSRNMTYDSAYIKTTNGPLPIRWMAIESILYREFTTASDVWSFGITLWEIGTLGAVPYPNIDNNDILRRLQDGYRIDQPSSVSDEVFDLMLKCCSESPSDRPTFSALRLTFDGMLSKRKSTRELYLDLNSVSDGKLAAVTSPMTVNNRPTSNVYVENSLIYSNTSNSPNFLGSPAFTSSGFTKTEYEVNNNELTVVKD